MSMTGVVGLQWGNEDKGKIVDMLSPGAEIVARFNGGDNAGHTVVNSYGTFKVRLTPPPDRRRVIGQVTDVRCRLKPAPTTARLTPTTHAGAPHVNRL